MAIRNSIPLSFRAYGVCDSIDASNARPGSMSVLQNLVPNPANRDQFVPRPAATQVTNFSGFTTPAQIESLLVIGTRAYGMIATARYAGKSEPFCYDLVAGAFVTISNVTSANAPTTTVATGDWTPPTMAMVGNRILITHPGYNGTTQFIGWIDMRNFSSTAVIGDTVAGTNVIINVHAPGPTAAGAMVGDLITNGTDVPAGTYITAMTTTTITLSQNMTGSTPNTTFTVTSGTTAAPLYGSGQTTGQPLAAKPVSVLDFNNRAYYAVNNTVQFSDSLNPTQITNATQSLTLGDNVPVTALGGLPLSNQVVGGTLQALIAFKQDAGYYQITGDLALSNLALNFVEGSVGTLAPLTICATPFGLAYVAPDGLRIIGLDGKSSEPIGVYGEGVSLPFTYSVTPSRMCAGYDQNIIRISTQNGYKNSQPTEEYWYDLTLKKWTGPHTFPAALISAYHTGLNDFVLAASGVNAKLWASKSQPSAASTYTENGTALSWQWTTTLLPDNEQVSNNKVTESTLGLTLPATQAVTVMAADEGNNPLDTLTLSGTNTGAALWGSFTWGGAAWGGNVAAYREYALNWHNNLVFKQMSITVLGPSISGFVIGNLYAKYQVLGYIGGYNA